MNPKCKSQHRNPFIVSLQYDFSNPEKTKAMDAQKEAEEAEWIFKARDSYKRINGRENIK